MRTTPRRKFSAQFKLDAGLELLTGHTSVAQICRERQISDKLRYDWKRALLDRAPSMFEATPTVQLEMQPRIAELERLLGRLTMENEILTKAGSAWRAPWSTNER